MRICHRRRIRSTVGSIGLVASLLLLAACGSGTGGSAGSTDPNAPAIGVSEINLSLPFFVQMQEASEQAAADYGVNVTWQSADGSLEKQISTVQDFIAQKKDVILIDPVNADALVPVVDQATQAGIKVVTMGNKVAGAKNHNTLYPDEENWQRQARILGTHLGGTGKVLLLIGSVGNYVSDTRQKAFEETMAAEFPGIEIITQPTNFDSSTAASVTQTVLTNTPDLAGIASISDGLTLPALKIAEQLGRNIPFVSNDGDPDVYRYIDDGQVLSNVLTGSHRVGAWNTAVAARLAKGSTLDIDVFMPTYVISSDATVQALAAKGLAIDAISTAEAEQKAADYLNEFGSAKEDTAMTVAK